MDKNLEMIEYQDHYFCKTIGCLAFISSIKKCSANLIFQKDCIQTVKDFHKWLNANGYKIVKKDNNNE